MAEVQCVVCSNKFKVVPARLGTAKFCSYKCAGEWRSKAYLGENNHRWKGGERTKTCPHCKKEYQWDGEPYANWEKRKFCSKACADKGGIRYTGADNGNWNPDPNKKKHRGNLHAKWQNAVISRDNGVCQDCGATNIELHAHHIKPYKSFPDLRYDVSNGITLCYKCHWSVHAAQNEKAVNSVKLLTRQGVEKDNTEPSSNRKVLEGVTTRGRAYRRVVANCMWCNATVSKPLSDVKPSGKIFCSKQCAGKYLAANRTYRRWKNPPTMAVISSTSAAPEREDIV